MDVAKVDLFFERLNHRLIIMIEKEFTCPYCWENQSRLFDPSIPVSYTHLTLPTIA